MRKFSNILIVLLCGFGLAGASEIHQAARRGSLAEVKKIVEADASALNSRDAKGNTPLHMAVAGSRLEVMRYLIGQGAGLDMKNNNGLTPLYQALDSGRSRAAVLLIESGADIHQKGFRNQTLLHAAARSNNTAVARLLLNKGSDVNARDSRGSTPLDLALEAAKAETGELLIARGGKFLTFDMRLPRAEQAFNRCIAQGESDVVAMAAHAGVALDGRTRSGHGLLHKGAAAGSLSMVTALLEAGLDVNQADARGRSALDYAQYFHHDELAALIRSKGGRSLAVPPARSLQHLDVTTGQARIWYLGHSAWAVRTSGHWLIFDYAFRGEEPASARLLNGYIRAAEMSDVPVVVFVSHGHDDHYQPGIFQWAASHSNISYVCAFRPRHIAAEKYHYLEPGQADMVEGVDVASLVSTDKGGAFCVTVDGVTFYHSGDHANVSQSENSAFHREIDRLAAIGKSIDWAFLQSGGACGGGYGDEVLAGDIYTIRKFMPKAVFPMHSGGNEHVYQAFRVDVKDAGIDTPVLTALLRGDEFIFDGQNMKSAWQ